MERERFAPPAVGGSSLLVMFAVLCLTIFALLGLSTVQADSRLSDASAGAVTGYYLADVQAERTLARLRSGQRPPEVVCTPQPEGELCTYEYLISESQALQVEVLLRRDGTYAVLRWQAAATGDWQADETLDLWDGDPVVGLGS